MRQTRSGKPSVHPTGIRKSEDGIWTYTPVLPVRITNPHTGQSLNRFGVFDTGADKCLCPCESAKAIGHAITAKGVTKKGVTGAGYKFDVYMHTISIAILAPDGIKTILATADDHLVGCGGQCPVLLLGRDLFVDFIVEVDFPKRRMVDHLARLADGCEEADRQMNKEA